MGGLSSGRGERLAPLRCELRIGARRSHPLSALPELEYVEKLQRFLVQKAREDGSFECANRNLALSSVRTFKELGVLREQPGPAGSILHLSETFSTPANCQRLEKFIWQFT
nr:glycerol-3-phosphate acyltransferase 2, mitochondrial-like [Pelodiscus sinensis]|eukprot:XP_014432035.1 glycerol-3-phosphate acyltransferase 2, mitochondrial-like [Pelodiscus sinensis]